MDMSQPIGTVVPTLDGPVLAVLARTSQPLTGRKVHQFAGSGSETGTRNVLRRLARTGLITATEVGASVQYALNREHLAARAVLELTSLRQRLFDRIRDAIEHWPVKPTHASIFGSTARGDGDLDSDVDLLLVHGFTDDPPLAWDEEAGELAIQVYVWTGNHVQIYELSESDLAEHLQAGEPIVDEWARDAVTVYGPDFRSVRSRIAGDVIPR
ncbi:MULTISPECIES: nucleotidyltransferase domain-containing protein [unclassified Kribbella]|uniref:nucleotidyltransferase domain-containing protein n=1 Tax=unclassified Kribbella TaxID=2644121 RepID=UPI00301817CD